jgi:hypothetical protein
MTKMEMNVTLLKITNDPYKKKETQETIAVSVGCETLTKQEITQRRKQHQDHT